MDKKQFEEIVNRLDLIARLLAMTTIVGEKSQKRKIIVLSSLGFAPTDIAGLLNTTVNTVNVTLSRARTKTTVSHRDRVRTHDQQEDLQPTG